MNDELDRPEVDPANGTEAYADLAGAPDGAGPPEPAGFTAPEKITSVVRAVLARPGDPKVRGVLAVITSPLGERLLLKPMLAMLPPLDEPDEWDEWLAILAGCALELTSDGVGVEVDQARGAARYLLAALFEESPSE